MALRKTDSQKIEFPPPSRGVLLSLTLLFFIVLDIGLLFYRLSDPFGGFHGLNEAWYSTVARNYASHSLLMPTYEKMLDLYLPPLLSYLLYLNFSFLGPSEWVARLVPVAFALLAVAGLYLLGKTVLQKDAGLEAAALFASTPVFLLVGRNVQTDILFVSLAVFSLYFYVRPKPLGTRPDMLVAGLFLGTAMFSKQFAVVTMIAIVVWELLGKERARLAKSDFMLFLLGTGLVLTPFYGYHLLHNPGYLLYTQFHGSASMAGLASGLTLSVLLSEIFWGCSPIVLFGGLAGLSLMLLHPTRHKVLVVVLVFAYFIFYLFLHKHSYYFLGMVPFLCLCATELSGRMPRKLYAASLTIALATATLLSAYQLAGCKYGFTEFKNIGEYVNRYDRPVVMVDQSVYNSYAPLLKYYGENATLMLRDSELSPSCREMLRTADRIFYLSDFPLGGNRAEIFPIKGIRHGLRLGSRVYIHTPPNIHLFAPSRLAGSEGSKIIGTFGPFVKLEQTSFYLIAQPPF